MLLVINDLDQATGGGKRCHVMLQTLFDGPILGVSGSALVMVATIVYWLVSLNRRAQRRQQNLKARSGERLRTLGT